MNEFLISFEVTRRSNVMTSARIQPFCKKHTITIGCYGGFRISPGSITERNRVLYIHKNNLCLFWKSQGESFNKIIENKVKRKL